MSDQQTPFDPEEHEDDEQHGLVAATPDELHDGTRATNPWFLILGIVVAVGFVVLIIVGAIAWKNRAAAGRAAQAAAQSGTVAGNGVGGNFTAPNASPTPFNPATACPEGTIATANQITHSITCQPLNGSAAPFGIPGVPNSQQPKQPLACPAGTQSAVVQTTNGAVPECILSQQPTQPPPASPVPVVVPRTMGGDGSTGGGYAQATPLPSDRIAISAPPTYSPQESQAQQDLAARGQSTGGPGIGGGGPGIAPTSGYTSPATPAPQQFVSNGSSSHDAFASGSEGNAPHYVQPTSSYRITPTSFIYARTLTRIVSTLPGIAVLQTTGDVWDSTHSVILVPNGTRISVDYDSHVNAGEGRLLVGVQDFISPAGREFDVAGALSAGDATGGAGLPGSVDNHRSGLYGAAAMLTLAGAAESALSPQTSGAFGQQSIASSLASAAGSQLSNITNQVVQQKLNQAPTITIEPGSLVQLIVTHDLPMEPEQ